MISLPARFTRLLSGGDILGATGSTAGTNGSTAGSKAIFAEDERRGVGVKVDHKTRAPFEIAQRIIRQHSVDYDVLALASFM